jgi:adenosylcobinamide kinase / adenosylcobinamide-phosphate guanylyltransferase
MITYISGGARSGKSGFAQRMALSLSAEPIYIATAKVLDEDFKQRVKRHQSERGPEWTNIEAYVNLYQLPLENRVVLIDCLTLWLTNFFMDFENDGERSLKALQEEISELEKVDAHFIIISNEIGMGLHADTPMGRKFVDIQGWANQYVAEKADEAIFMVSGLPLYLKQRSS